MRKAALIAARTLPPTTLAAALLIGSLACRGGDAASMSRERTTPTASRAHPPPTSTPYVVVLGTAQDGGLPQMGCEDELCRAARADPAIRRRVTSLLLADPRSGKRWLFDAGPDLPEQAELARDHPAHRAEADPGAAGGRPPLFDGVFLTHAHVGHYAGLAQFGREIYGAREQVVFATARMEQFLAHNGPWNLLLETGAIRIEPLAFEQDLELAPDLRVSCQPVPHRDEYSDTVLFVIRHGDFAVGYLPDIDKWERWSVPLERFLAEVDLAFVDGTFFADGEVPGRAMAEIPHPFVSETLARLASAPAELRAKVVFTHLNHTNPAAIPGSDADRAIRAGGMRVALEGEIVPLARRNP